MTKHYTAQIKVTSTEMVISTPARYTNNGPPTPTPERVVVEIASIIIRETTLEKLVDKTQAHLELVNEVVAE